MNTWRWSTIGKEANILTGFPFPSAQFSYVSGEHRLLRGDNVAQGSLRWENAARWPHRIGPDIEGYELQKNDVVLAMDRPWIEAGLKWACVRADDLPALLVQRVARLRAGRTLDQTFLRYIISSKAFTEHVLEVQTGTSIPHISGSQIREFRFIVPPLPEQRAIARILGALDDKIELNRKMNRTLEDLAQALFRSWFVDFDPVVAKSEGRKPYGMDAATAALFPSEFQDSEMGRIPRGWRWEEIRALTSQIQYGYTASACGEKVGPQFLRITDIQGGRVDWSSVPFCRIPASDIDKYLLREGDIVVARTGASTGENFYVLEPPTSIFASYLVKFRFSSLHLARYVGLFLRSNEYFEYVEGILGGSAQPNASAQILAGAKCVVPTTNLLAKFYQNVSPLDCKRRLLEKENALLTATRDALLPKLLSGEIRLKQAEQIVEKAV